MTIQEFIQTTSFNDRDTFVLNKMYSEVDKTSTEWANLLKKDFQFNIIEEKKESETNKNKNK